MESSNHNNSNSDEIAFDYPPNFRAYKDGRVIRSFGTDHVSPSHSLSKDVVLSPNSLSLRIFIPNKTVAKRVPVVVYYHGGGWCFGSAFCATYNDHLKEMVAKGAVIGVSVEYRLAPEFPLPIGYEDSWEALKWVASHSGGKGPEAWLNDYADLQRVFVSGDSAGGNIAHNMALQAGLETLPDTKIVGACLVHPAFVNKEGTLHPIWKYACPNTTGFDDPRVNPSLDTRLPRLACSRVLVFVAENDKLKGGGEFYYETLEKSEWGGTVELVVSYGEGHVFHLFDSGCENAKALVEKMVSFFNQE